MPHYDFFEFPQTFLVGSFKLVLNFRLFSNDTSVVQKFQSFDFLHNPRLPLFFDLVLKDLEFGQSFERDDRHFNLI